MGRNNSLPIWNSLYDISWGNNCFRKGWKVFLYFSDPKILDHFTKILSYSLSKQKFYHTPQKELKILLKFTLKQKLLIWYYIYLKQKSLKIVLYIYPVKILCMVASQKASVTF